ncbi:hypothetical protein ElyMa_001186700 [Elysia marginata]|uniref:IBB domain-containing protein n=1 Tax=Elysia marginata TaxID=1093978 RepID=A0AAV4I5W6_9GAST|nr:hypothetical protein ElyMa_001186700 [Elysia marginata]
MAENPKRLKRVEERMENSVSLSKTQRSSCIRLQEEDEEGGGGRGERGRRRRRRRRRRRKGEEGGGGGKLRLKADIGKEIKKRQINADRSRIRELEPLDGHGSTAAGSDHMPGW